MKGKWKQRVLAFLTSAALVALIAIPVQAEGTNKYTPGASNTNADEKKFTFNKDLKIEKDYNIPASTFSFAAKAGEAITGTDTTYPVNAGIDCNKISFSPDMNADDGSAGTMTYAANSRTDTTSIEADSVEIVTDSSDPDHYIARKVMTMDFSAVQFTEPGIYRYIITESGNNAAIQNDSEPDRTLDVYVVDATEKEGTKKLEIAKFVFYKGKATAAPQKTGAVVTTKSEGYENIYPVAGLTFGKEVKGNQGSKDKYFKFTLSIEDAPALANFIVNLDNADATIAANPNDATKWITSTVTQTSSFTAGSDGKATATFYLQDGQYITVYGFTKGVTYAVTEEEEDYESAEGIEQADSTFNKDTTAGYDELKDSASGTFAEDSNHKLIPVYTGFTNTKEGLVPTGVILSVAPWAIAGIVLVAGIAFFMIRSRRRYEEN